MNRVIASPELVVGSGSATGSPSPQDIMSNPTVAQKFPYVKDMPAGTYYWCACGNSKTQPLCDGSHKGTAFSPVKVDVAVAKNVAFCGCQSAKNAAFCDGSHSKL